MVLEILAGVAGWCGSCPWPRHKGLAIESLIALRDNWMLDIIWSISSVFQRVSQIRQGRRTYHLLYIFGWLMFSLRLKSSSIILHVAIWYISRDASTKQLWSARNHSFLSFRAQGKEGFLNQVNQPRSHITTYLWVVKILRATFLVTICARVVELGLTL